jgi:hypothetical protein
VSGPDNLVPELEGLRALFEKEFGHDHEIGERERNLLVAWERRVRERVLAGAPSPIAEPHRWRLPDERLSLTHCFAMTDPEGFIARCPKCDWGWQEAIEYKAYLTMGMYDDGRLGELFCTISKEGSFVSGIMDALTFVLSVALQHGVPLESFTRRMRFTRFQPSGMVVGAPTELRGFFSSLLDYLARFLEHRFPEGVESSRHPRPEPEPEPVEIEAEPPEKSS